MYHNQDSQSSSSGFFLIFWIIFMFILCIIEILHSSFWIVVSKPAPDFEGTAIVNGEAKTIKLSDYKGKYLVFFFYPLDL